MISTEVFVRVAGWLLRVTGWLLKVVRSAPYHDHVGKERLSLKKRYQIVVQLASGHT